MSAKIGSFEKDGKSFPTIKLNPDNQKPRKDGSMPFGFSFGLGKARLILTHIEDIKGFVAQYGGKMTCLLCEGKGYIWTQTPDGDVDSEPCPGCDELCSTCGGKRIVQITKDESDRCPDCDGFRKTEEKTNG